MADLIHIECSGMIRRTLAGAAFLVLMLSAPARADEPSRHVTRFAVWGSVGQSTRSTEDNLLRSAALEFGYKRASWRVMPIAYAGALDGDDPLRGLFAGMGLRTTHFRRNGGRVRFGSSVEYQYLGCGEEGPHLLLPGAEIAPIDRNPIALCGSSIYAGPHFEFDVVEPDPDSITAALAVLAAFSEASISLFVRVTLSFDGVG